MNFYKINICLLILLLGAVACNRDDEYEQKETTETVEEGMLIQGNLNGLVLDDNSSPIDLAKARARLRRLRNRTYTK